ncbi:hypothetical protein M422DRAFT_34470 [Sphaerobolus stellatus SS14]|uniref:Uncharacterized protein n=1 Tax=Sphaerobolus stellatus (strain SS14) TaxID=990650 RepID=A0A0C9VEW6_SPHS4|nr:hypothetical protein M422DRAFT_34470 [Sphaerobolus stellatus SS14]
MSQPKVWLITGASSGFGRAVTEHVLSKGDIVVATLRKPSALSDLTAKYDKSRLLVLKLDVSNLREIKNTFATIERTFGRLDVVHNNAGYGLLAEAEATPEEVARDMFEVNFWGLVNVSKEAVRFFREVNKPGVGGRLLNTSSMAGIGGLPAMSFYSASKFAVEGFSEALSKEMKEEWNIKIIILAFGAFKTNAVSAIFSVPLESLPAYQGGVVDYMRGAFSGPPSGGDPVKAAREIYRIANEPNAPARQRVLFGSDVVGLARGAITQLQEDTEKSEPLAERVAFPEEPAAPATEMKTTEVTSEKSAAKPKRLSRFIKKILVKF